MVGVVRGGPERISDLVAAALAWLGPPPAPRDVKPRDIVWAQLSGFPAADRPMLMRAAAWLWKTGVRDVEAVQYLLEEGRARGVRNWYAYYAPRGECRKAALLRYQRGESRKGG